MDEVKVVVAHSERATLRVGDVFLKVDADQARIDVEVDAMALAPVPTPEVLWRKPPVLAIAAVPGSALGRLGEPSTASPAAWSAAGAAIRRRQVDAAAPVADHVPAGGPAPTDRGARHGRESLGSTSISPKERWSRGVVGPPSRLKHPLRPLRDPHGAIALAEIDGLRVASSILPWRNGGGAPPWAGQDQGSRTAAAVTSIRAAAPVVWGGDWNHELTGRLYAGSKDGQTSILGALDHLGLSAPTEASPHRLPGALSIDHVAVPAFWTVVAVERVSAIVDGVELSDHDAYVVEIE